MTLFFEVQSLDGVHARIGAHLSSLPAETVTLFEAGGRTLAWDLVAPHDLPGFSRATMDGYAVIGRDTFGSSESSPAYLELAGEVLVGQIPAFTLERGRCARIPTGAMLPTGADAVVMEEHSRAVDDRTIEVCRPVAPGTQVLGATDDARQGEVLLPAGRRIRPQDTGILAALGVTQVGVVCRPRVGILSSGDEIVPPNATPAPGQVRDVNGYTLDCQVRDAGGVPLALGLVPDAEDALRAAVDRALSSCDLLLLSGGSSVGIRDLTARVFLSFPGAQMLVHGVSVAPGKPFLWVHAGGHHLLGLPGQVASCMIAFHLFVEPMIERLLGREPRSFTRFARKIARLARKLPSVQGREEYVRVRLVGVEAESLAEPVFGQPGLLRSLIHADGLVRIPRDAEGLDAGTAVEVLLFP